MFLNQLANHDTLELFDKLNLVFYQLDDQGNYLKQNSLSKKLTGSLVNAQLIDIASWEDCLEVITHGMPKAVKEKAHTGYWYMSFKLPFYQDSLRRLTGFSIKLSNDSTTLPFIPLTVQELENVSNSVQHQSSLDKAVTLTPREQTCLRYLGQGLTAKQIAQCLNISMRTMDFHLDNIKDKLNCAHRHSIIAKALELGLLSERPIKS